MNGVAVDRAGVASTWHAEPWHPDRDERDTDVFEGPMALSAQVGYQPVLDYITGFWDRLIRFHPHDTATLIGLPRPYLVPATDPARPLFQEMYYWDSYFSALGIVGTAHEWLVFDMAE